MDDTSQRVLIGSPMFFAALQSLAVDDRSCGCQTLPVVANRANHVRDGDGGYGLPAGARRAWMPGIGKDADMSSENSSGDVSPTVQLFQRAHQKITQLGRIDEQIAQLLSRRRGLQDELRSIQGEINEEFDRQLGAVDETSPARAPRPSLEHVIRRSVQFAGEPIETAGSLS